MPLKIPNSNLIFATTSNVYLAFTLVRTLIITKFQFQPVSFMNVLHIKLNNIKADTVSVRDCNILDLPCRLYPGRATKTPYFCTDATWKLKHLMYISHYKLVHYQNKHKYITSFWGTVCSTIHQFQMSDTLRWPSKHVNMFTDTLT